MSAAGEWLTLGTGWHKCAKPDEPKIELARARAGALWRCSECGLVWELSRTPASMYGGSEWTWTEFQES